MQTKQEKTTLSVRSQAFVYGKYLENETERSYECRKCKYEEEEFERICKKMKGRLPNALHKNRDFDCFITTGDLNVNDRFICTFDLTGPNSNKVFTFGNFEGARRLINKSIIQPQLTFIRKNKNYFRKKNEFIIITCFKLLAKIHEFNEGEIQRDYVNFQQKPSLPLSTSDKFKGLNKEHIIIHSESSPKIKKFNIIEYKITPIGLKVTENNPIPLKAINSIETFKFKNHKQHLPCSKCSLGTCVTRRTQLEGVTSSDSAYYVDSSKSTQVEGEEQMFSPRWIAVGLQLAKNIYDHLENEDKSPENVSSQEKVDSLEGDSDVKRREQCPEAADEVQSAAIQGEEQSCSNLNYRRHFSENRKLGNMRNLFKIKCNLHNLGKLYSILRTYRRLFIFGNNKLQIEMISMMINDLKVSYYELLLKRNTSFTIDSYPPSNWNEIEHLPPMDKYEDSLRNKLLTSISLTMAHTSDKNPQEYYKFFEYNTTKDLKIIFDNLLHEKFIKNIKNMHPQMMEQGDSYVDKILGTKEKLDDLKQFASDKIEGTTNKLMNKLNPSLNKFNKLANEASEFQKELKEETIPQFIGLAKNANKEIQESRETIIHMANKLNPLVEDLHSGIKMYGGPIANNINEATYSAKFFWKGMSGFFSTMFIVNFIMNVSLFIKKPCFLYFMQSILALCGITQTPAYDWIIFIFNNCKNWTKNFFSSQNITPQYCAQAQQNYDAFTNYNSIFNESTQLNVNYGAFCEQGFEELCFEQLDNIKVILAIVSTLIFGLIFGKLPTWNKIKDFIDEDVQNFSRENRERKFVRKEQGSFSSSLRDISYAVRGFEALDKVYHYCLDKIERIINYFLGKECHEILIEKECKEHHEKILQWIRNVEEIDNDHYLSLACSDYLKFIRIGNLYDESEIYLNMILENKLGPNVIKIIHSVRERLVKAIKSINRLKPSIGFRKAPFVIYLYGKTGTCKSALMTKLNRDIAKYMNWPRYNLVYPFPTSGKYMSGYSGQLIVNIDDLFQNKETSNQLLPELMPICGNQDYSVDMPIAEEKGRKFTSQVIIITSNTYDLDKDNMLKSEAFARRINIMVEAVHCDGVDAKKIISMDYDPTFSQIQYSPMSLIDNDENRGFYWKSNVLNNAHPSYISYDQLLKLIWTNHIAFDKKQEIALQDYLSSHGSQDIDSYLAERMNGPKPDWECLEEIEVQEMIETMGEQGDDTIVRKIMVNKDGQRFEFTYDIAELDQDDVSDILIFEERFSQMSNDDVKQWYSKYHKSAISFVSKSKVFYEQTKEKINRFFANITHRIKTFNEKHPNVAFVLGFITAAPLIIYTLKNLCANLFNSKITTLNDGREIKLDGKTYKLVENHSEVIVPEAYCQNIIKPEISTRSCEAYSQNILKPDISSRNIEAYSQNISIPNVEHRSIESNNKKSRSHKKNYKSKQIDLIKRQFLDEQGNDDEMSLDLACNVLSSSIFDAGWNVKGDSLKLKGFFLGGKVIIIPFHFFRRLNEGDSFYIQRNGFDKEFIFSFNNLQRIGEKDLCIYYLGPQIESRRSIVKYFVKERNLNSLTRNVSSVLVGSYNGNLLLKSGLSHYTNELVSYVGKDGYENLQYGWEYDLDTQKGECGAFLLACTNTIPQPQRIIGIHTAGYTAKRGGFSVIISQEKVCEAVKMLNNRCSEQNTGIFSEQCYDSCEVSLPKFVNTEQHVFNERVKIFPIGDYTILGTMDAKMTPSQPTKTNFIKTCFYEDYYPNVKIPAPLAPFRNEDGIKISPLQLALRKYGKTTKPFSQENIFIVSNSIQNELNKLKVEMNPCVTDLKTAIFGIEGMKYCEKINFNSSAGWPYQCMEKEGKGKNYLFDLDSKTIKSQFLLDQIQNREIKGRKGLRVPSIWRDCMKDELRPIEKAKAGKTRLFTIAPLDFTILTRKYFLAFEQCFYKNHSKFFSAVGINAESYEWTEAYRRLATYGDLCVAGDFGSFDGTLMPDLMDECVNIINKWYEFHGERDPEAQMMRKILFDEMIHTCQMVNNCVYLSHQGNPSGNPMTVIINTIVNIMYMRLAWMEIMQHENKKLATMDAYLDNVKEEAYGDDNRLVIKKKVIELFNQVSISSCLARHGIEYTDELKSMDFGKYKLLKDTSFLKRGYRVDDRLGKRVMLPLMNWDTITNLMNWTRKNLDMESQMQSNMRQALGFAFFHGKEKFNEIRENFTKALLSKNWLPVSFTYEELFNIFESDITDGNYVYSTVCGIDFSNKQQEGI